METLIFLISRSAERLGILLVGAILCYLGYKMILQRISTPFAASGGNEKWFFNLATFSPGLVFAALGVFMLGSSIWSKGSAFEQEIPGGTKTTISFAGGDLSKTRETLCAAIVTIDKFTSSDESDYASKPEADAVKTAKETLNSYKDSILIEHFGAKVIREYREAKENFLINPSEYSTEERELYDEIAVLDSQTNLD